MDSGSEYSEKMLEIPLLPGVFGPEKVKKIKIKQNLTHALRVAELKCPNFSNLFSFQKPVLMS